MPDGDRESLTMEMPYEVIRWVRTRCRWPMREKMAYLMLYSRRGTGSPEPYPSVRTLAEDMGTTKDAAAEAVHQLQELGALQIVDGGGRNGGNSYRLLPPWEAVQELQKKPRGRHARTEEVSSNEGQSSNQGQSLKEGQSSNQGQSLIQAQLSLNQGQQLSSKQGHKEPIEGANEESPSLPPQSEKPPEPERVTRQAGGQRRTRAELKPKDPDSETVQAIVVRLDELLREAGQPGVESEKWGETKNTVKNVLKGKGGDPAIPPKQALEALEWAWTQPGLRSLMLAAPARSIRSMWGRYLNRDNQTQKTFGNRYQDHNQYKAPTADPWA